MDATTQSSPLETSACSGSLSIFESSAVEVPRRPLPSLEQLASKVKITSEIAEKNLSLLKDLASRPADKMTRLSIEPGGLLVSDRRKNAVAIRRWWHGDGIGPTSEVVARTFLCSIKQLPKTSCPSKKKETITRAFSGALNLALYYERTVGNPKKATILHDVVHAARQELGECRVRSKTPEEKSKPHRTTRKKRKKKKHNKAVEAASLPKPTSRPSLNLAPSSNTAATAVVPIIKMQLLIKTATDARSTEAAGPNDSISRKPCFPLHLLPLGPHWKLQQAEIDRGFPWDF